MYLKIEPMNDKQLHIKKRVPLPVWSRRIGVRVRSTPAVEDQIVPHNLLLISSVLQLELWVRCGLCSDIWTRSILRWTSRCRHGSSSVSIRGSLLMLTGVDYCSGWRIWGVRLCGCKPIGLRWCAASFVSYLFVYLFGDLLAGEMCRPCYSKEVVR